jgi:hypothetical protein
MSAASGVLEDAPEPGNMFTTIKNYLVAVGLPTSPLLTQHAAEHHHEDVPDEVAKEVDGTLSYTLSYFFSPNIALEQSNFDRARAFTSQILTGTQPSQRHALLLQSP